MSKFIKKKIIQLRLSFCDRKIKCINRKIYKLNKRRESAYNTRDRLVLAINNGHYGYEEIRDFEKIKSSEIVKIDYEVCAIQESLNSLFSKAEAERNKMIQIKQSL